jgi:hypothetical protein
LADYNQNIKVTASTKDAERELSKLDKLLKGLSSYTLDLGKGAAQAGVKLAQRNLQDYGRTLSALDNKLGGFGKRLGDIAKAFDFAGKTAVGVAGINALGTALSALPKFATGGTQALQAFGGVLAGISAPAAKVAAALAALGPQGLATAGGIAAATAAFMAFGPAVRKVVTGLDNLALGGKIQAAIGGMKGKVEETKQSFLGLNTTIETTVKTMNELAEGMSLRQLNSQVSSLTKEMQSFHSSTQGAWEAAQGLVRAQKAQVTEQRALNELVRQAKGLQPQDVRDAEVARRRSTLTSGRNAQKRDSEAAANAQTELAALRAKEAAESAAARERLKSAAAARTLVELAKQEAELAKQNLEVRYNWLKVLREGEAAMAARQSRLQGANYGLGQVPAGGQLFPGGNTRTAQEGYRQMLNAQALTKQAAEDALQKTQARTVLEGKSVQVLRTRTKALSEQAAIDARSVEILRQQNAERIKAEQLDARALTVARRQVQLADLKNKKKKGEELQKRVENTLVSGAFPLLFGAGPLATAGGFAGGALGSANPMIGVFTSAIGQVMDQFAAAAMDMGKALRDPITNFQKIKDAGLLAGKSQEYYVQKLIEVGRVTEAAAVVQGEIAKKIGYQGVSDLQQLGVEADNLSKAWAELNLSMQALIAGPLGDLLRLLAGPITTTNGVNQMAALEKDLKATGLGGKFEEFKRRDQAFRSLGPEEGTKARLKLIEEYRKLLPAPTGGTKISPEAQEQARKAAEAQADAIKSAYREAFQLQRQAADITMAAADFRRKVESDIFAKNQEAARQEIDNARKAAQLRIEASDLALRKQFSGSQGLTEELLNGVRAFISARRAGEADIAQKRRQLEVNLADINKATADYIYEQAKSRLQLERQIEDYKMAVADYQLKVARQVQEQNVINGALGTPAGGGGPGVPGRIGQPIEYLTGDRSSSGYRADHGGNNYHEHIAYATAKEARAAAELLNKAGIKTTELKGVNPVGRHSPNSYHYDGRAFDVPAAQVPVGQEQALSRRVRQILGIGGNGAAAQFRTAAAGVPRPTFGAPGADTQGMVAANDRLIKAKQEELALEQKLQQLNIEKGLFDLQELAQGKSRTQELSQQRDLEKAKLGLMTTAGAMSENELERVLKQAEGESQINAIYTARDEVLKQINDAVKQGKLTQDEANVVLKEINTGLETRVATTRAQIALEQELLKVQQEQQYLLEKANAERQLSTAGAGLNAGFIGGAGDKYESTLQKYGSPEKAAELARLQEATDLATMKAQALESAYMGVGGAISSAMTQGVADLVSGAKTAEQVFADMLKGIGDALISAAQQMIATYIAIGIAKMFAGMSGGSTPGGGAPNLDLSGFKAYPMLASGGSPTPGQPTIVGERGPELFVPGQSGGITNNQNLRSMMASNDIKARGRDNAPVLNMNFETTKFMDRDWVDREQLEAAMAQSAKKGAADGERRAMDRLRQSPRTRRSLGL